MAQNIAKVQPTLTSPASDPEKAPLIVESQRLLQRMKEVSEAIGRRAYDFFEQRGHEIGRDIDDWLHAECELLRPVRIEISEDEKVLKVRAEVPGFSAKDIQVSVEPRRIIISGKNERSDEQKTDEWRSSEIFRALELPAEVDPARATAQLKDGILQLSIEKAVAGSPVAVEVKAG
jgi:HSP20 family protein